MGLPDPFRMKHIVTVSFAALVAVTALAPPDAAVAQDSRHRWSLAAEAVSARPSSTSGSWLDGGAGKLRFGDNEASIARLAFDYSGRIKPTLSVNLVADYVDDGASGIDLTEAYLEWHPVPKSANRQSLKLGAFFPDISLENKDSAWASAYTVNSSAINTWIAEEIRTLGAEWRLERPLGAQAAGRSIDIYGAGYYGNDPAGTLLVWKGWSIHDRQTRLNDVLPLPAVPQIAPGMMFDKQAPRVEPFIETDDQPGFYFGTDIKLSRRVAVALMHYDNPADPLSLRDGQYGWSTRFDHVGLQIDLPGRLGLVAQRMEGSTAMGPVVNGAHVAEIEFDAWYLLLTRSFGKHRVTLRRDDFGIDDLDSTPLDANNEAGDAWTLAYRYDHSDKLSLRAEWLEISTWRPAWAYFGLPLQDSEQLLQLQLNYRLASTR
jgi:hypothetical protein